MKRLAFLMLTVLACAFTSCTHTVESVTMIPEKITLIVGESYQLQAVVKPDKAPQEVKWTSNKPSVATVNDKGNITAVSEGTCDIIVYADLCTAVCHVSVIANGEGEGEGDDNTMDLTKINFMDNGWIITDFECEEEPEWLAQAIQSGAVDINPYGNPAAANEDYRGWHLDFVYNNSADFYLYVEYFKKAEDNKLEVSTDQDIYTGNVIFSQDKEKVYISYTGTSYRGGKPTIIKGYKLKSKFKL